MRDGWNDIYVYCLRTPALLILPAWLCGSQAQETCARQRRTTYRAWSVTSSTSAARSSLSYTMMCPTLRPIEHTTPYTTFCSLYIAYSLFSPDTCFPEARLHAFDQCFRVYPWQMKLQYDYIPLLPIEVQIQTQHQ